MQPRIISVKKNILDVYLLENIYDNSTEHQGCWPLESEVSEEVRGIMSGKDIWF